MSHTSQNSQPIGDEDDPNSSQPADEEDDAQNSQTIEDDDVPGATLRTTEEWGHATHSVLSICVLTNITIGSGLLNFSQAYSYAGGVIPMLLMQTIIVLVTTATAIVLVHCSQLSGAKNYQLVIKHYTGNTIFVFCNVLLLVHCFGTCISLLIVIGDQLDKVMSLTFGKAFCQLWYARRSFTVTISALLFISPLLFTKNMAAFKFTSIFAVISTFYLVLLVLIYYGKQSDKRRDPWQVKREVDTNEFLLLIPIISYSYEYHFEVVSLYVERTDRSFRHFLWVIFGTTLASALIYNIVGCVGYLTFGAAVTSDLLVSYDPDAAVLVGMGFIAFKEAMAYPIIFYVFRVAFEDGASILSAEHYTKFYIGYYGQYICPAIFFLLSILITVNIPSLGSVFALVGAAGSVLAISLPGLCLVSAYRKWDTFQHKVMVVSGVVLVILGLSITLMTTGLGTKRYLDPHYHNSDVECIEKEIVDSGNNTTSSKTEMKHLFF